MSQDLSSGLVAGLVPGYHSLTAAGTMTDESTTLTPMADLAGRWGVTSNTVSRRLAFLGIKPTRQGNYRFLAAEQVVLADQLQE